MRRPRPLPLPLFLAAAALPLGGCFHHGTRLSEVMPDPARGATVTIRVDGGASPGAGVPVELVGELILVRGDLLVVAQPLRYVVISQDRIRESWIGPHHVERSARNGRPGLAPLDRVRLYARHPYGLTNAQLAEVMRAEGLDRLAFLRGAGGGFVALPPDSLPEDGANRWAAHETSAALTPTAAFLDSLAAVGPRFARVEDAIAAGYRRLGPAFPGMGEHWIHPGRVVRGRADPSAPAVLAYAEIDGERRLIAAAFTVPLEPGEPPPSYPAGPDVWHDHSERVDEEVLLLTHAATHETAAEHPRLAMFHAWVWLENPEGVFAQNNWTLPFAQAGLDLATTPSPHAARALSLLTAGPDHYLALFEAAGPPTAEERRRLEAVLGRHGDRVAAWRAQRSGPVDRDALLRLEEIWFSVWQGVRDAVGDGTWLALAGLAEEDVRASVRRPIRIGELRAFASVVAPLYFTGNAPGVYVAGVRLPIQDGHALRAQVERSGLLPLGRVCYLRCYAAGNGRITFWDVGLDLSLGAFNRGRGSLVAAFGVGQLLVSVDAVAGHEPTRGPVFDDGATTALFAGLRGSYRVLPFAALTAELATYIADSEIAGDGGSLYPSLRAGLEFGRPAR